MSYHEAMLNSEMQSFKDGGPLVLTVYERFSQATNAQLEEFVDFASGLPWVKSALNLIGDLSEAAPLSQGEKMIALSIVGGLFGGFVGYQFAQDQNRRYFSQEFQPDDRLQIPIHPSVATTVGGFIGAFSLPAIVAAGAHRLK